jgi:hypothetical protein
LELDGKVDGVALVETALGFGDDGRAGHGYVVDRQFGEVAGGTSGDGLVAGEGARPTHLAC